MLLFQKFNNVSVVRASRTITKWDCFVLYLYYVCSFKFIRKSEIFNVGEKICQRKSEFCTQILILLKPSLIHVHLRNDSMVI